MLKCMRSDGSVWNVMATRHDRELNVFLLFSVIIVSTAVFSMTCVMQESAPTFSEDHRRPVSLLYSIDLHLIT